MKINPEDLEKINTILAFSKPVEFAGVKYPVLCDVVDQIKKANFMPICLLSTYHPEFDYFKQDSTGYNVVHYAVAFGNLEVSFFGKKNR